MCLRSAIRQPPGARHAGVSSSHHQTKLAGRIRSCVVAERQPYEKKAQYKEDGVIWNLIFLCVLSEVLKSSVRTLYLSSQSIDVIRDQDVAKPNHV